MDRVAVIVASYGDQRKWMAKARNALASLEQQTRPADEVIYVHGETLAKARNAGASSHNCTWQIFLDADDELDKNYIEAMLAGWGEIRQPATLGVVNGKEDPYPVVIPKRDLTRMNYVVIGAMHPQESFFEVRGFDEMEAYEDWVLWLKMWIEGNTIVPCPEAIYRVNVTPGSRNDISRDLAMRIVGNVHQKYAPIAQQRGLL